MIGKENLIHAQLRCVLHCMSASISIIICALFRPSFKLNMLMHLRVYML